MKVCIAATLTCAIIATLVSSGWWTLNINSQQRGTTIVSTVFDNNVLVKRGKSSNLSTTQTALPQLGHPFDNEISAQEDSSNFLLDNHTNTASPPTQSTWSPKAIHDPVPVSLEPSASMREATKQATRWLQGLHVPRDFWFRANHTVKPDRSSKDVAKMQPTAAARALPPAMLANPNAVAAYLLTHARSTGDAWLCAVALTHARLHFPKGRACSEVNDCFSLNRAPYNGFTFAQILG